MPKHKHVKGQGQPTGRFKQSDRSASSGPKTPGQRFKSPRGKMKIGSQPVTKKR